ncbi:MAG: SAVED domain-containing protein [Cyclobacteriaceae bacterium]
MGVIPEKVSKIVWGRAAGRCQFRNCGEDLIGDLVANVANVSFGEQGHIIGASAKGPRGNKKLSEELAKDPGNILLLCHKHHRIVDDANGANFSVDELHAMKDAHERIVRAALSSYPPSPAHAVTFLARVGSIEVAADPNEVRAAMVAAGMVPNELDPIDLSIRGLGVPDDAEHYWPTQTGELRRKVEERIHGRIDKGEVAGLALFAFAPMPLLVELGSLLPDHQNVSVFQLHREPRGWKWANDRSPLSYSVRPGASRGRNVALKIEVSSNISDDRIAVKMPAEASIWSVQANGVGNDVIRRPEDLSNFRAAFRRALREIGEMHPEAEQICIFPAMPVSCAVELGRARQPKADLPLEIWDQVADQGFVQRTRIE